MIVQLRKTPRSKRYARAIRRLINAEIAESWKGGGDPDDWDAIALELKRARAAVRRMLKELDHQ